MVSDNNVIVKEKHERRKKSRSDEIGLFVVIFVLITFALCVTGFCQYKYKESCIKEKEKIVDCESDPYQCETACTPPLYVPISVLAGLSLVLSFATLLILLVMYFSYKSSENKSRT